MKPGDGFVTSLGERWDDANQQANIVTKDFSATNHLTGQLSSSQIEDINQATPKPYAGKFVLVRFKDSLETGVRKENSDKIYPMSHVNNKEWDKVNEENSEYANLDVYNVARTVRIREAQNNQTDDIYSDKAIRRSEVYAISDANLKRENVARVYFKNGGSIYVNLHDGVTTYHFLNQGEFDNHPRYRPTKIVMRTESKYNSYQEWIDDQKKKGVDIRLF